jgi:hypothetical protein
VQNLVDCSDSFGNAGFINSAFQYIKVNGGIDTEESLISNLVMKML